MNHTKAIFLYDAGVDVCARVPLTGNTSPGVVVRFARRSKHLHIYTVVSCRTFENKIVRDAYRKYVKVYYLYMYESNANAK